MDPEIIPQEQEIIPQEQRTVKVTVVPKTQVQEQESIPEEQKTVKIRVVPITQVLETGATSMGMVACWWVMMLMQGGIFFTDMETKDCLLVMVIFLLIAFRHVIHFRPRNHWSSRRNDMSKWANIQQLWVPIDFINGLSYLCKLVSAIICAVLSVMRLVSQDFGPTKDKSMATRIFALNVFYVLALIETLLSLFELTLRMLSKPEDQEVKKDKCKDKFMEVDKKEIEMIEKLMREEKKVEMNTYMMHNLDSQQQDQSNNFRARRKVPSVDPAEKCKQTEEKKVELKKSQ